MPDSVSILFVAVLPSARAASPPTVPHGGRIPSAGRGLEAARAASPPTTVPHARDHGRPLWKRAAKRALERAWRAAGEHSHPAPFKTGGKGRSSGAEPVQGRQNALPGAGRGGPARTPFRHADVPVPATGDGREIGVRIGRRVPAPPAAGLKPANVAVDELTLPL